MYSVETADAGSVCHYSAALIRSTGARAGQFDATKYASVLTASPTSAGSGGKRHTANARQNTTITTTHFAITPSSNRANAIACALDAARPTRSQAAAALSHRHGGAAQGGCQRMPVHPARGTSAASDRGRERLDGHRARCCAATCGDGIVHARLVSCGISGQRCRRLR